MKSKEDGTRKRGQKLLIQVHGEGPSWILLAGGALVSTLVVRLGFTRLNHFFQNKKLNDDTSPTEKENSGGRMTSGVLHSDLCCYSQGANFYQCPSEMGTSPAPPSKTISQVERSLPLVKIQPAEKSNMEANQGIMWSTSPDQLGLPHRSFHPSVSSESLSESGSDIYVKREVIHRLRQQLQRRDEMIMEMQSQILELKNSLSIQMANSANLEAQIDSANRDLFASEREIQRLRKVIADHCAGPLMGHANGNGNCFEEVGLRDEAKVEMLKKEIGELKEVLEGKNFLLQSYRDEKAELCSKIKELQLRLASQVPSIL
ncbi:intracellular protein transporter [Rhynchospora pubera]|uniref:Intracellular protein transporter n=1 Tax=Rhynchospora pubera TaxID=906938 RepID=A0AAV8EW39_9POAL|nr:intracellular protein transporter [Rhynchospora pubera]